MKPLLGAKVGKQDKPKAATKSLKSCMATKSCEENQGLLRLILQCLIIDDIRNLKRIYRKPRIIVLLLCARRLTS